MSPDNAVRPARRRIADKISIVFLIVVGSLGALIGILDTFGEPEQLAQHLPFLSYIKDTSALVLIIVSLLAIAGGVERYASFEEIREAVQQARAESHDSWRGLERELQEIHHALAAPVPVRSFGGREQLYKDILRILRHCKGTETIRATSLIEFSQEGMAEHVEYLETLAGKIRESRQGTVGMLYRVVLHWSDGKGLEESIRRRKEIFAKNGVEKRIDIRESKDSWGMDVLIIGQEHVFIAFPMQKRSHDLRFGFRISDRELVEKVTRWYDECVWQEAAPVVSPS